MPRHLILKGLSKMYTNYNMNQLTLDLSTSFSPKENLVTIFIKDLVEALQINESYLLGRPREYELGAMMKLFFFRIREKPLQVARLNV